MGKILITGGAGYIGSHTCVELLNESYEIIVADNFSNSKPQVLERVRKITGKDFPFYNIDVCDKNALAKIFTEQDVEAVIHFAGFKSVGESVSKPLEYYKNNIISTLSLCEEMQKAGIFKFVFSSSATVYGDPDIVPISEEAPLHVTNPYGRTKLIIEEILRDLSFSDKRWSIVLLRYFNPVGAHESGLIGEDPNGIPNNILPYISQVAIGKLEYLNVYGDDYPTPDGTGVRDYIHVTDLAKGHCSALDYCSKNNGVVAVNLGTGNGYSVFDLLHAFEKASGKKIPYKITSRRPGDVAKCYAEPTKAKELFNWTAKHDLDRMCEDSWRWQSMNPTGYDE